MNFWDWVLIIWGLSLVIVVYLFWESTRKKGSETS